jgi:hypothetical protein
MVGVAQQAEHLTVDQAVEGSNPFAHPFSQPYLCSTNGLAVCFSFDTQPSAFHTPGKIILILLV